MLRSLLNVVADRPLASNIWSFLSPFQLPVTLRHPDTGTLYSCHYYDMLIMGDEIILAYRRSAVCRMWLDTWRVTVHNTMLHQHWGLRLSSLMSARFFQRRSFADPFFYCWTRRLLLDEGCPRWENMHVRVLDANVVLDTDRVMPEANE